MAKINYEEAKRLNEIKTKAAVQGDVIKKGADLSTFIGSKVDKTLYSPARKKNLL